MPFILSKVSKRFTCVYMHLSVQHLSDRENVPCLPKALVLSSSKYPVLLFFVNIARFPFQSKSLVYLSGYGARCSGFNRSRCNEVECCTSELPFVLDSTPGRKPLSHIIIAH